jgi:Fe-S cluster assembly ATPase SufC
MTTLLQIKNLKANAAGKQILKGIDLEVNAAKSTRSWARMAPARARSRAC